MANVKEPSPPKIPAVEVKEPIVTQSLIQTYTTAHFFQEIWRVRWMLVMAGTIILVRAYGLMPEDSPVLKMLYRPALGAMGFVLAHVAYQQAFPYLNMRDLLYRALAIEEFKALEPHMIARVAAAAMFVGSCIIRGLIYGAFVVGAFMAV